MRDQLFCDCAECSIEDIPIGRPGVRSSSGRTAADGLDWLLRFRASLRSRLWRCFRRHLSHSQTWWLSTDLLGIISFSFWHTARREFSRLTTGRGFDFYLSQSWNSDFLAHVRIFGHLQIPLNCTRWESRARQKVLQLSILRLQPLDSQSMFHILAIGLFLQGCQLLLQLSNMLLFPCSAFPLVFADSGQPIGLLYDSRSGPRI